MTEKEERRACKEIIRQIDKKLKGNREKLKLKKNVKMTKGTQEEKNE